MEDNIKALYKITNDSTIFKNYNIIIEDTALNNENIVYGSFSINEKLCASDSLNFGECNACILKLQVAAELGDISGKKLSITQTINKGNIAGQIGLGEYNIESATLTANKKYRDIVAYDNIILFNKDVSEWYENLTFPITLFSMFESLCTYVGVIHVSSVTDFCNANMSVEKTISSEEIQGITVLKCIAELNGGFFRAKSDYTTVHAPIEFIKLSNTVKEIFEVSDYSIIKKEDFKTEKITKLVLRSETDDIGVASGIGTNTYVIEDNFLLYGKSTEDLTTIADNIYPIISEIEYVPYTAMQIGLPYLHCGDVVQYKLTDESTFISILMQRTLSGTQILKDEISSHGTKTTEITTGIAKEIIKLKGKTNTLVRNVEENILTIENVENGLKSQISQSEDSIISTVSENYYDKTSVDTLISSSSTSFEQSLKGFEMRFETIDKELADTVENTSKEFEKISKYIRYEDGKIILGESTNSLELRISNDELGFYQKDVKVAYFSNNKMHIVDAEIEKSLMLGNFAFTPRANGNLSFNKIK